jgi:hypothetical protein
VSTQKERRLAHISAMQNNHYGAQSRYDGLLAYFEDDEPEVSDAIRFGIKELLACPECGHHDPDAFVIDYPSDHPKSVS